jgi:hypothetical protein
MEQASSLLEYGVIGLIAFLAISVAVFFYLKIEKLRTEKEDYIIKSNDYKESLLEKTLTALTAVEMAWITHKNEFNKEVIDAIEKANQPLVAEVKEAIKEMKR